MLPFVFFFSALTYASVILRDGCGVVSPPITFPAGNDSFQAGQSITVRWNTSVIPQNCTPYTGFISLGYNYGAVNPINTSRTRMAPTDMPGNSLAPSVDIRTGSQQVTLPPNLTSRDDYVLLLWGDALNVTPFFLITGPGTDPIAAPSTTGITSTASSTSSLLSTAETASSTSMRAASSSNSASSESMMATSCYCATSSRNTFNSTFHFHSFRSPYPPLVPRRGSIHGVEVIPIPLDWMSSPNAEIIQAYRLYREVNCFNVAARSLFIWDYVITFSKEVRYVWGRKPTIATVLFMVNRYVNLSVTVFQLFSQASSQRAERYCFISTSICKVVVRFVQAQITVSLLVFALFFSLRIYATWGRDWRPALPILLLALVPPATNLYQYSVSVPVPAPLPSVGSTSFTSILCVSILLYRGPFVTQCILVTVTNRACTTSYDFLVVLFTFMKTLGSKKAARRLKDRTPLVILLLRDGTLHFLLMLILNLAQIIVASLPRANNALSYFMSPLTSILISRFLLNLRRINDADEREATSVFLNTSIFSARQFHSELIGNLGEELDWGTSVGTSSLQHEYDGGKSRAISQDLSMDTISMAPSTVTPSTITPTNGVDYELTHLHEP
ncbi:hypothetical protein EIP91_011445 [Steccherinum ochraceum]|uniref:DUF6533 domain-containing protein n=1 Tax=Steccherinum ochraceum TaxID=92696 RepID=A0A4V2MWZ6_9APHY|nr:hypothetical protein EIP91_011445 [Steccherinum ochraceum]